MGNIFNQQLFCGGSSGPYDFDEYLNGTNIHIYFGGTAITSNNGFNARRNIQKIDMPHITSIGANCLSGCTALELSEVPTGVTSLQYAFCSECTAITRMKIHNRVTTIAANTLRGCSNLAVIDLTDWTSDQTPPTLVTPAFQNHATGRKFYFRDQATLNTFAAATNWASFANDFTTDPVPSS